MRREIKMVKRDGSIIYLERVNNRIREFTMNQKVFDERLSEIVLKTTAMLADETKGNPDHPSNAALSSLYMIISLVMETHGIVKRDW